MPRHQSSAARRVVISALQLLRARRAGRVPNAIHADSFKALKIKVSGTFARRFRETRIATPRDDTGGLHRATSALTRAQNAIRVSYLARDSIPVFDP
jgi:hypothetical protein